MLFYIPAQVTFFFWYFYCFSKGLSSKDSKKSPVASITESARILTEQVREEPKKCRFVRLLLSSPV